MTNQTNIPIDIEPTQVPLFQQVQSKLPDADSSQVQRFVEQIERLSATEHFFKLYPEDKTGFEKLWNQARKALDYNRPYRIAIIGTTGVGKSKLINAMLGRNLVQARKGKPATGTALHIFLDVPQHNEEKAYVTYRDEANIRSLINEFAKRYDLDTQDLAANFSKSYSAKLLKLEPKRDLGEQTLQEFDGLKEALADIVNQYLNFGSKKLSTEYSLANIQQIDDLKNLTDENSSLNENPDTRKIGLVKSVAYHIKAAQPKAKIATLELPNNVCLVDLPGLDGTPLHDLIIGEGIKEADAVIFILRPPRILNRGDTYLLDRINKHISLNGSFDAAERIFLVVNAKDNITKDDPNTPDNLPRDMLELMKLLSPDYATHLKGRGGDQAYFMTSAWMAYNAQQALQGNEIDDPDAYTGRATQFKLDPADHQAILEMSDVPALVGALTKFARERRIENQINLGQEALDRISRSLINKYKFEIDKLTEGKGLTFIDSQYEHILNEHEAKLIELIIRFRRAQLDNLENLYGDLQEEAGRVWVDLTNRLQEEMPYIWKKSFMWSVYRPGAREFGHMKYEQILGDAELYLWRELADCLKGVAEQIADDYRNKFKQSGIATTIIKKGYNQPIAIEIVKTELDKRMKTLQANLTVFSTRVTLSNVLNPDLRFLTEKEEHTNKLIKTLTDLDTKYGGVPSASDVTVNDFEPFIKTIHHKYEEIVKSNSVSALLNIYEYEMICVEDYLLHNVEQLFRHLRKEILLNNILVEQVRQSDPDKKRDKLESLRQKLNRLSEINKNQRIINSLPEPETQPPTQP